MQYIKCNTPRGQYLIPLRKIAEHRANYYAFQEEEFAQYSQEWNEEVEFVIHSDYEGIDWLMINSDWEDWEDIAIKESDDVLVSENDFWCNPDDFKIIHK